jgi:hypothetical protein
MENNFKLKALKYKMKYLNLKNKNNFQITGGVFPTDDQIKEDKAYFDEMIPPYLKNTDNPENRANLILWAIQMDLQVSKEDYDKKKAMRSNDYSIYKRRVELNTIRFNAERNDKSSTKPVLTDIDIPVLPYTDSRSQTSEFITGLNLVKNAEDIISEINKEKEEDKVEFDKVPTMLTDATKVKEEFDKVSTMLTNRDIYINICAMLMDLTVSKEYYYDTIKKIEDKRTELVSAQKSSSDAYELSYNTKLNRVWAITNKASRTFRKCYNDYKISRNRFKLNILRLVSELEKYKALKSGVV